MKIKNKEIVIIFLVQSLLLILAIPYLEYPDSGVYIEGINSGLFKVFYLEWYHYILKVLGYATDIKLISNINYKGFFTNTLMFNYLSYFEIRILILQIFNLIYIYIFYKVYKIIFDKKFYKVSLLYLIWPQINYYLFNITTDFLVYLYTPIFVYFLIKERHILNFFISILIFEYIDNNTIVNMYFIIIYVIFRKLNVDYRKTIKIYIIFLLVFFLISKIKIYDFIGGKWGYILNFMQNDSADYLKKMVAFDLTSIFFAGSGNIVLLPIIYIFYNIFYFKLYFVIYKLEKIIKRRDLNLFMALNFTVVSMITIVPNYAQVKYYTFYIFSILYFSSKYKILRNKLVFYFGVIMFWLNLLYLSLVLKF